VGPATPGVLRLPSGRLVRGRGLRRAQPSDMTPTFGVYLLGHEPPPVPWEARWITWPDFWLPRDRTALTDALREAWSRAVTERVEIACGGGYGRTGTALACLACSTACRLVTRFPTYASTTHHEPSRCRGNDGW